MLARGGFWQARHAVLKNPAVIFFDSKLRSWTVGRFEVAANAEAAVGVDTPGKLDPEFILFPYLAWIGLVRVANRLAITFPVDAQHGLAIADPASGMCLLAHQVMALAAEAHWQNVVGVPGGLTPDRREGGMQFDLLFVRQHLDPGGAVGVCPDGIVATRKVGSDLAAPFAQEVGQQDAHFVVGEGIFGREEQLIPGLRGTRFEKWRGHKFVPAIGRGAARSADAAGKNGEEPEGASDLPAAQVSGAGGAPGMSGKGCSGLTYLAGNGDDRFRGQSAFTSGEGGRVLCVKIDQQFDEALKCLWLARMFGGHVLLPVNPAAHIFAIEEVFHQQDARHRQQYRRFRAGPGWEPVIGHAGSIGEARVHNGELSALHLPLDDALRLRVEIMTGFQVRADEQDEASIGVIGRGTVGPTPELVAETGGRGADVGMAVVTIYAPGAQHALHVAIMPGPPDMIHHFITAALDDGGANLRRECFQHLVPGRALPFAFAAPARALEGIEDASGIVDLVDGGRALGAIPPATAWMVGIALEFFDTPALFINIGEQATGRLTVETDGRDDGVVFLDLARPGFRIVFDPIIPFLRRRAGSEIAHGHLLAAGSKVLLQRNFDHMSLRMGKGRPPLH